LDVFFRLLTFSAISRHCPDFPTERHGKRQMYSSGPDAVHYATHIQSGFDGDFINITNDGSSSALIPGGTGTATTSSGNICIGVYSLARRGSLLSVAPTGRRMGARSCQSPAQGRTPFDC